MQTIYQCHQNKCMSGPSRFSNLPLATPKLVNFGKTDYYSMFEARSWIYIETYFFVYSQSTCSLVAETNPDLSLNKMSFVDI